MAASSLMLAHQVAGKAVRDGLFLSRFTSRRFAQDRGRQRDFRGAARAWLRAPVVAVRAGQTGARGLRSRRRAARCRIPDDAQCGRIGPRYRHHAGVSPSGGFGAILLSGFWSIVSEHFDPREAKRRFGQITSAGTVGGIVGGLMAERGSAWFGVDALLLLLSGLHLASAVALWLVPGMLPAGRRDRRDEPMWQAARDALRQAPFLGSLAALVLLGTLSAALLDYLFKSNAAAEFGPRARRSHPLLRVVLHRVPGGGIRRAGVPGPARVAESRTGPDGSLAFDRGGVRRRSVDDRPASAARAARARSGGGVARIVPSIRLRAVLHPRAAAREARRQDIPRRGVRPHGRCRRRRSVAALPAARVHAGGEADPVRRLRLRRGQHAHRVAHGRGVCRCPPPWSVEPRGGGE